MRDKSISFNEEMVRALLEGRKTQTRRPLSLIGHDVFFEFGVSDTTGYDWCFRDEDLRWHEFRNDELLKLLRYQTGDRLWVREGNMTRDEKSRTASRLTLLVTDVRVQRLQDISEEDAEAEGIFTPEIGFVNLGERAPIIQFGVLWNSIYGPNAWDANPWVSAVTFTVHNCNIDQMEKAA